MKDRNHSFIYIDAEKSFDKMHSFKRKILRQFDVEKCLNIIKATCDKPTANTILNDEMFKAFLPTLGTRVPTLTTSSQHCTASPSQSN